MLEISYEEIGNYNLANELRDHAEISFSLSAEHVESLKMNWDLYERYYDAKEISFGSTKTAYRGIMWALHRAYIGIRHKNLEELIHLYTGYAKFLKPVEFRSDKENMINAYFRRK